MPLFSRSSEKKQRSHRFSFRRHSHEPSEPVKAPAANANAAAAPAATATAAAHPQPSTRFPAPLAKAATITTTTTAAAAGASGSITSDARTSVASSLRSSASLSFIERHSGGASGRAETSSSSDSESEAAVDAQQQHKRRPFTTPPPSRSISIASSSSSSTASTQSMRNSLADYRQLRCSMSYKNRVQAHEAAAFRSMASTTLSTDSRSGSERRSTDVRATELSARISESSVSRLSVSASDELLPPAATTSSASSSEPLVDTSDATANAAEVRMTEANVAAMQTRRALQQMVLSFEDDDDDSDDDDSSETDSIHRRRSSSDTVAHGSVLQVSADDYRKFQFRLRQLEDLCHEQARKQASIEETIEREVRTRTRKVVDAMEKNIAMYKQAKELECERELQKRLSELEGSIGATSSARGSTRSTSFRESSGASASVRESSSDKSKPLDKLFHPRRARRRLEQLREREELQKREMEHFRAFIRSTDVVSAAPTPAPMSCSSGSATAALKDLGDPHLTESLLHATPDDLIEMVCVLRKHVGVQETQLTEAKRLISAAIEAREDAEETARDAVELTLELDARLERASHEIVVIRDELLRESQLHAQRSLSPSDAPRRPSAALLGPDRRRTSSGLQQPVTPSGSY